MMTLRDLFSRKDLLSRDWLADLALYAKDKGDCLTCLELGFEDGLTRNTPASLNSHYLFGFEHGQKHSKDHPHPSFIEVMEKEV